MGQRARIDPRSKPRGNVIRLLPHSHRERQGRERLSHPALSGPPRTTARGPRIVESASVSGGVRDHMGPPEGDKAEARTHFKVARFIMEAGVKLGLRSVPLATACTLYHQWTVAGGVGADPYLVAMTALYLAGKVEEQHLRSRDVLNVCHRYLHPSSPPLDLDARFWELRDSLAQCELLLLRCLCFRVSFQHPHKYLLHYLLSLQPWLNRHTWGRAHVTRAAWALLRDSYHGPLGLQHPPQHLAAAILALALACYGLVPPCTPTPWWQVLSEDLEEADLARIVGELLQLYALDADLT